MPRQTSINLSPATERQVFELTARGYGNFTKIVALAIDRFHTAELDPPVTIQHGKLTITVDNEAQARAILGQLGMPLTEDVDEKA